MDERRSGSSFRYHQNLLWQILRTRTTISPGPILFPWQTSLISRAVYPAALFRQEQSSDLHSSEMNPTSICVKLTQPWFRPLISCRAGPGSVQGPRLCIDSQGPSGGTRPSHWALPRKTHSFSVKSGVGREQERGSGLSAGRRMLPGLWLGGKADACDLPTGAQEPPGRPACPHQLPGPAGVLGSAEPAERPEHRDPGPERCWQDHLLRAGPGAPGGDGGQRGWQGLRYSGHQVTCSQDMAGGGGGAGRCAGVGRGKGESEEALGGPSLHPISQPSLGACVHTLCCLPGRATSGLLRCFCVN